MATNGTRSYERSKGHRYERSKDATNGAPGLTTRNKKLKLLGAKGIATRFFDAL